MVTPQTLSASPTNQSSCDSTSCSGSSTPQRTSSPFPVGPVALIMPPSASLPTTSMFHNGPLFTPPRALSPQAPAFHMSPSAPIKVPGKHDHIHPLQYNTESLSSEGSPIDSSHFHSERSDTPHSMHSTTSNESSDSGYCGYVESFPCKISFGPCLRAAISVLRLDYYKLNRLYKALAIQKLSNTSPTGKGPQNSPVPHQHHRRAAHQNYHHQQQQQQQQRQQQQPLNPSFAIPSSLSVSPPTPTPMNINQVAPFYAQAASFLPMPTTVVDGRKSKY